MKTLLTLGFIFVIIGFTCWGVGLGVAFERKKIMGGYPAYVFKILYNSWVFVVMLILSTLFVMWANIYIVAPK